MYINSIDTGYYVSNLRSTGITKSIEPINRIDKYEKSPLERISSIGLNNSKTYASNIHNTRRVAEINKSYDPELNQTRKVNKQNNYSELKKSVFNLGSREPVSTKQSYILHVPGEDFSELRQKKLSNNQLKLKEFYTASTPKKGIMVNLFL